MRKKLLPAVLVFVGFLVLIAGLFSFQYFMRPFGKNNKPIEFIITPKTPLHETAHLLQTKNIIRSEKLLIIYMRLKKLDRKVQSGVVLMTEGDGIRNASQKLLLAKPIEINLMIPEGLTIEQTAHHIYRTLDIDTTQFIFRCYDTTFVASCSIAAPSLEGYLFPDTYRLPEKVTTDEIIRRMTVRHREAWASITIREDIAQTYTPHQIITLASIVEREATLLSEQPHISGVFHNRLRRGYPLGADPTVRFALKKFGGPLRVSELNSNSPYNTRKFAGLPPGPICSPGKGAIDAAGNPLDTKDMYFVAKWDGSGEHDFSVTNAEHDRKKIEIRNNNQRRLKRKAPREQ